MDHIFSRLRFSGFIRILEIRGWSSLKKKHLNKILCIKCPFNLCRLDLLFNLRREVNRLCMQMLKYMKCLKCSTMLRTLFNHQKHPKANKLNLFP